MIKGIHHVAIADRDPAGLSAYLQQVFGLTPMESDPTLLAAPNAFVAVLPALASAQDSSPKNSDRPGAPLNAMGLRHVCFQNNNITALAAAIADNGGALFASPVDLGTGNQYAYARDCKGNIYEIEGLPYADAKPRPWIGHLALVVDEIDAAIKFYTALLGSELRHRMTIGPSEKSDIMSGFKDTTINAAWLYAGNMLIELLEFVNPVSPSPLSSTSQIAAHPPSQGLQRITFETDDAVAMAGHAKSLGATVLSGPVKSGDIVSAAVQGPQGVILEFIEFQDASAGASFADLDDPFICARVDGWAAHAVT